MLEAGVEEAVDGILGVISPKYLNFLIDHGFYVIESTFYALRNPTTEIYEDLNPQEANKVEKVRVMGEKVGLPLLGMLRYVAARFPYEAVDDKVTPEWLKRRGREKFPELVDIIEERGEAGKKWLKEQCREIVEFATGRLLWSDEKRKMVPVRYVTP